MDETFLGPVSPSSFSVLIVMWFVMSERYLVRITSATSTAVDMLLPLALIITSSGLSLKAVITAITYDITVFLPMYTVFFFMEFHPRVSKFGEGGGEDKPIILQPPSKDIVKVEDLKYSKKGVLVLLRV